MNAAWDPRTLVADRAASRRFVVLLVLAYVALIAFVALHHEPWRDEADPWLYVRDADLATILARTRYAGLPALWFLCLMPLAKLGLPYASQKVLHGAIAAAAVALLAARAPFSRLTKVLLAFSYYFAFEYAIVVRSYAITVLLTFVAATLYARSRERPIAFAFVLLLLFNCNAQGFFIAGAFAALFVLERFEERKFAVRDSIAVALMAIAAIAAYLQVRTPPDPARQAVMRVYNGEAFPWVVGNAFLPTLPLWSFLFGLAMLLLITMTLRRAPNALLVLWLPLTALAIIHTYVWLGGLRHAGFFLLLPIVAIWIGASRVDERWSRVTALLLNLALIVSVIVSTRYAIRDTNEAFTGAEEMATFISDHQLDRVDIAAHSPTQAEALLPYFQRTKFWYAGIGEYGSYMKWDTQFERAMNVSYPLAEARARAQFAGRPWLLLFNVEMPNPPAHGFRLLYTNQRPIFEKTDERYWLYAPTR